MGRTNSKENMKLSNTGLLFLIACTLHVSLAGRWRKRAGKGGRRGGKGGNNAARKAFHHVIAEEAHQCFRDTCWDSCFTEDCQDCKSACHEEHTGEAKQDRKAKRVCLRECKKDGTCPKKFKQLSKTCKVCKKGCFKTAMTGSTANEWIGECKDACDGDSDLEDFGGKSIN